MRLPGEQRLIVPLVFIMVLLCAMSGFAMDDFPEEIELGVLANLYDPVMFDHAMHVDVAEDCSVCHHHTTGSAPVNSYCLKCHPGGSDMDMVACQDCHASPAADQSALRMSAEYVFHDDQPNLKAAYHLNCLGCHREVGGPVGCEDCHAKTEAGNRFYHSGEFAPATQPHDAHAN